MNFVVVHSVLEEKFAPSGCKSSLLLCVSSSKLDTRHFQAGHTRPCWQSLGGAGRAKGTKGTMPPLQCLAGCPPWTCTTYSPTRWNQNTLWMLLPVTPTSHKFIFSSVPKGSSQAEIPVSLLLHNTSRCCLHCSLCLHCNLLRAPSSVCITALLIPTVIPASNTESFLPAISLWCSSNRKTTKTNEALL